MKGEERGDQVKSILDWGGGKDAQGDGRKGVTLGEITGKRGKRGETSRFKWGGLNAHPIDQEEKEHGRGRAVAVSRRGGGGVKARD